MLARHHYRCGGVPQQRSCENQAPAVAIGGETEEQRADEESCERGCDEAGESVEAEERRGRACEEPAAYQTGPDVGGEKQIVIFEPAAERQQQNQRPDVARSGQALEARANSRGAILCRVVMRRV